MINAQGERHGKLSESNHCILYTCTEKLHLSIQYNYVSTKMKNKACWSGSVGKTFALQARRPEFHSQIHVMCVICNPEPGRQRQNA